VARSEPVGAIDIGSNSIKLSVGWRDERGEIVERSWPPETVRLGAGLEDTGRLADDRMDAAVEAVRQFVEAAREAGARRMVAVATEATRAAANGPDFLARLRRNTGIDARPIDGDEEARLTFRGLAATSDLSGSILVADIGGGSTELIAARDGAPAAMRSLPLGSGRLTDRLVQADPPTAAELTACADAAAAAVADSARDMRPEGDAPLRLIVVGGTGEYLQRLVEREPADRAEVARTLAELTRISARDLAVRLGIAESRARVLPAGIAIVAAVAAAFDAAHIDMARSGVRLGLLMEALQPERERDADG
jgi:exopolyphosphatase / guanosine-5'-triphosphate,3'-diphosphate pyrophosphatase